MKAFPSFSGYPQRNTISPLNITTLVSIENELNGFHRGRVGGSMSSMQITTSKKLKAKKIKMSKIVKHFKSGEKLIILECYFTVCYSCE